MSLILEALRRADRARVRDVATRIAQHPPPLARRPSPWPWIVAAVGAAAAVALVLVGGSDAPVTPPATADAHPAVERSAPPPPASTLAEIKVPAPVAGPSAATTAAPPRDALPAAIRAALPDIELDAHVWAENPGKRFVMTDGRLLRVGDTVAEGLVLTAIDPDGAEFAWRGTRFRVPAR